MFKKIVTPLSRADVFRILWENEMKQADLAREYDCTPGNVSLIINGHAESKPFWAWFFNRFPEAREYQHAS